MRRFLRLLLAVVSLAALPLQAQVTRDLAVDLQATVSPTVPRITLTWTLRQAANITAQQVYRRLKGEVNWTLMATLTTTDTSWADPTALAGVEYEYWMRRTFNSSVSPNTPVGYLSAGVNLPMVENRGKLLLVVDDTMLTPLGAEIAQLQRDLRADGWQVQTISAPRRDALTDATAVADTKALIKAAYDADSANVKQVYILGHVPVPYAGSQAPDGHGNHFGAWSADGFYGDMDGVWTDTTVTNTSSTETRIHNVPGDGKLDQSTIPSTLELMVGRVDLRNMQRAPASTVSEVSLLRRYLRKAHDFKYKQGPYATTQRRVLIRDGFGLFSSESFMRTGWSWGFTGIGRPPEVLFDEAPSGDWWTLAATNNYLMANGNGGGSYETCSTVGNTADFGRRPFRAAFVSLFGSYFGDWDVTNNFMKAPLAGNATGDGLGLTCFWAGRPTFFMHHMATGETVGYAIRASLNSQFSTFSNPVYTPINFPGGGTHLGLMGDPSLRMHMVEPPRNLTATSANGSVSLAWSASSETNLLGYHVYRAATPAGPFTRLTTTPLAAPAYVDTSANVGSTFTYLVRTLKLETSPGGTYENLSQGEFATIAVSAAPSGIPLNPTNLVVTPNSSVNALLTWTDNATNETGYRIERMDGPTGSFLGYATVAPGATSYTDNGPFLDNEVYFYRVLATGNAGDSLPSNEASLEAVPGFFEFADTKMKVAKTIGTLQIPVKRFGGVNGAVSVNFATSNYSAVAGTHYTAASGTLNWADGETGDKMISVPITNTATPQMPRQFRVTLSGASSGTGIGTYNGIAVVIEDGTAPLLAPWLQANIGAITDASPAVQAEGSISSTTMGGTGLAAAGTTEAGQFVYQARTGDGVMTAFVPAALPVQGGARFAVMIRDGLGGGGLMAGTVVSSAAASFPARMISRTVSGGNSTLGTGVGAIQAPCWLRITRAGNSFQSEASTDGSTWINQGTVTAAIPATALWGLFHTSDDRSGTTYSGNFQTIGFQNVAFTAVAAPGEVATFSAGTPTANTVTLTWTAAVSAAGYRLERRSEAGSFAQIIDLPSGTLNFTDSSLAPDTGYEYRIYAYNNSGTGPLSTVARVTTTAPSTSQSVTTEAVPEGGDATIRGGAQDANFGSETTLRIGGSTTTGAVTSQAKLYLRFDLTAVPATATSAVLRLAVAGTGNFEQAGYNFSTTARLANEASDAWSESTITWNNAPLNNTATSGFLAGTTTLGSYSISDPLRVPSAGAVIGIPLTASILNTGKGANGIVSILLNTTSTAAWMDFGAKEHATLPPPTLELTFASTLPTRPSFLTVTEGTTADLPLAWTDNSAAETGFEIQRRPAGGSFATLLTTAANATDFTDTTTTLGEVYEYRVRAVSAAGPSAWSLIVAATAGGSTGPLPGERLTFATWMQSSNLTAEAALAADADADGDGVANLIEYALGSPANYRNPESAPQVGERQIGNDRFLTLTFARRVDATDVALLVEVAGSLEGPWTALDPLLPENQAEVQTNTPAAGWQTITVKDKEPMQGATHRFIRLRATLK